MIKIMFVCHGNICRSPMAEFVMKDMVSKKNLEGLFFISSSATSTEEIGSPVHPGTTKKLKEFGISTKGKYAVLLTKNDYEKYDYFIGMDSNNIGNINKIFGSNNDKKVFRLMEFANMDKDIADPWYTGNFDLTYSDIKTGCSALLEKLLS